MFEWYAAQISWRFAENKLASADLIGGLPKTGGTNNQSQGTVILLTRPPKGGPDTPIRIWAA